MRTVISTLLIVTFISCQTTSESGWQADPDIVSEREQQRPEYLWQESGVPRYELPDPLQMSDGTITDTREGWQQRREEILELFRTDMYGHRPGTPDDLSFDLVEEDEAAMEGSATLRRIAVHSHHENRAHEFEITLFLPNASQNPVPLFLLMNNRDVDNTDPSRVEKSGFWPAEEVIERGYGIAAIQNNELSPDDEDRYHEGIIRLFEGEASAEERSPDAWGALAAWGWGASRAMDYFETDSGIDETRIAVLGHSRGGKAALWAGAEDDRFSIVISNESGSGGAALSRRTYGETIRAVNRFTHWFAGNFEKYNDREDELPFDQHMLISLMAPRAVYVASANEDLWADPRGEFLSLAHASPVYALWNHEPVETDDMPVLDQPLFAGPRGYHVRAGSHNLLPVDWSHFMDFADRIWQ